ncbi:MAG: hypothetical protein M0R40_11625 [Firmicutes bacterium]|nr:hypothetical protein [Bacillota bacterium]
MIKYFYNLYFEYDETIDLSGKMQKSSCNIGYFSSKKKAKEIITSYKDKPGFNQYPIECFKIQKIGLKFDHEIGNKTGIALYELSHEFEFEKGKDEWTIFGVYNSEVNAQKEQHQQMKKRKYATLQSGFNIAKWKVDVDFEWKEGFESFSNAIS